MLLFVFFAVLVWYGAFTGRRRLGGIAALAAGIVVLLAINAVHYRVAQIFGYEHLVPVFRVILYPYIALVGAVGLFMVWLPIELPRGELHCRACMYDLSDLKVEVMGGDPCPECGATLAEASTRKGRRLARKRRHARGRLAPEPMMGIQLRSAPQEAQDTANDQDEQWKPADEEPLEGTLAGGVQGLDDRKRGCVA